MKIKLSSFRDFEFLRVSLFLFIRAHQRFSSTIIPSFHLSIFRFLKINVLLSRFRIFNSPSLSLCFCSKARWLNERARETIVPRPNVKLKGWRARSSNEIMEKRRIRGEDEEFPRTMRRRHAWPFWGEEVEGSILCKPLDP